MPKTPQQKLKRVAECLYLNESSGKYYGLVKKSGKQIKQSLKTQDRKIAERRLREFREEVGNLNPDASQRKATFDAIAAKWLTQANTGLKESSAKRNTLCVKNLNLTFTGQAVSSITRFDCEEWASKRSKNISARTYNLDLQVLKRVFQYAVEHGLLLRNPATSLKPHKGQSKEIVVPTLAEFETLVETLQNMRHPYPRTKPAVEFIKLLAYSGMRQNEAASITWGEIDFSKGTFVVSGGEKGTKSRKSRTVPLFPKLRKFLEELRTERKAKDANACQKGETVTKTRTARTAMLSACRIANLRHFDHHCLRHFFATNAIELGVDFKSVAAWLGHTDGGKLVADTYGHLRESHSFEMAQLLA